MNVTHYWIADSHPLTGRPGDGPVKLSACGTCEPGDFQTQDADRVSCYKCALILDMDLSEIHSTPDCVKAKVAGRRARYAIGSSRITCPECKGGNQGAIEEFICGFTGRPVYKTGGVITESAAGFVGESPLHHYWATSFPGNPNPHAIPSTPPKPQWQWQWDWDGI